MKIKVGIDPLQETMWHAVDERARLAALASEPCADPAESMLRVLQHTGAIRVRIKSLKTGRPKGRPFTIRYVWCKYRVVRGYQIEQAGAVEEPAFLMSRDDAWRWMHNLVRTEG